MYNKKLLSKAVKDLGSRKAPPKKQDKVVNNKLLPFISSEGFKQGPPPAGTNYRIPGNTIYNPTPYNINAVGSNGEQKFIAAGDTRNYTFDGADYVDEYQAEYGGDISIPQLNQYEDGGEYDLTQEEIDDLIAQGYDIEDLTDEYQVGGPYNTSGPVSEPASEQDEIQEYTPALKPKAYGYEPEDYSQFQNFAQTLPSNLQDPGYQYGNPDQYDLYGMWRTVDKPKSFKDVQDTDYFTLQPDNTYHGFSVGDDGTLLKPMGHHTTWMEVMNSQLNTDPYFRENRLIKNEQGRLQYVPNRQDGGVSPLEGNYISKVIMNRNRGTDFVDRAYALGANPGTPLFNVPDDEQFGAHMSHKMAYGEGEGGKTWMFPTVLNPKDEAIEVPGQYADYISSEGYKYATGMKQKGGFQDDINRRRKLLRDWTYGASIGTLHEAEYGIEMDLTPEEIEQYKKGGYVVDELPKKKNSKRYSRSLLATNPLFVKNPFLKKAKSKKRKIFDPNAKYYQDGGFQDDINKHRKLLRDWTYGESIGMLEKAQKGKFKFKRLSRKEEEAARFNEEEAMRPKEAPAQRPAETTVPEQSFDYWAGGPGIYATEKDIPEIKVTPKEFPLGHWLKYKREFEKTTPYKDFASERKKKYLRRTSPGLNKLAGVSEKNFPERAERRIKSAYDEKMNTYIFERMGQELGFNPSDRTTWVDTFLSPNYLNTEYGQKVFDIISNSKYGSKIEPSVWSKFMSGSQQFANIFLPKEVELRKKIPGYTEKENVGAQTSATEALKIFEPTSLLGNYFANLAYAQDEIAGTEGRTTPSLISGEINPEVDPLATLITDPSLPFQFIGTPFRTVGKGLLEGTKTTAKILKGSKLASETGKKYEKYVSPAFKRTTELLDKPLSKGFLAQEYQKRILGMPELQVAFNAAQAPKTAIGAAATPASLLRAQTMATGIYTFPQFAKVAAKDYNTILSDETTFDEKTSAMRDMSRNVVMQGLSLSPFVGSKGLQLYQSNQAAYAYMLDNLSKLKNFDPEAARAWLNAARLATGTKKTGGETYEIDDKTRRVLAKLGYQVEDVD